METPSVPASAEKQTSKKQVAGAKATQTGVVYQGPFESAYANSGNVKINHCKKIHIPCL